MRIRNIIQDAVLILIVALGSVKVLAADEKAANSTLDQVNARISVLESEMIQSMAAQHKASHQAEYTDENAISKRIEAKKAEKQLLELRREYDNRLRILDPEIRRLEAEIGRRYEEMKVVTELSEAIEREISFTESGANQANASQTSLLQNEADQNRDQVRIIQDSISQLNKELTERKKNVAVSDKDASGLAEQIRVLEDQHGKTLAEMNSVIDENDEIKKFDARRREIMVEIQQLRAQRTKLIESAASGTSPSR